MNEGVSLIISFYKRIDFLALIFLALEKQTDKRFEVILAEDAEDSETIAFINNKKKEVSFNITHLSQPDNGFRKNAILNKAIAHAKHETIVFIDGDCVPHKEFIKEYLKSVKPFQAYCGRRVMLSQQITDELKITKSLKILSFVNLLAKKCTHAEEGLYYYFKLFSPKKSRGLLGCNWGINKKHLLDVNGFDETYVTPCVGEDVDIEWRLKQIGVSFLSIRNHAVIYHLYHPEHYNGNAYKENIKILEKTQQTNQFFCINGIIKTKQD